MGWFSKKKQKEQKEKKEQANPEVRPGGVFMVQLLMKEPCAIPPKEQMAEVLSRYLGKVEAFGGEEPEREFAGFAALEHIVEFEDGKKPVLLSVMGCQSFQADQIDEMKRNQMWDRMDDGQTFCRDLLKDYKYAVLAHDMLGGGMDSCERANMLMDYLEALLELYPSCEAVYFVNSGRLVLAEKIRRKESTGLDRYVHFAVNVRFFNISGTEDSIVDTLGLSLLYIEDLQYHFHGMDPDWVVRHAYSMASYLLKNNAPIKDGDTIDGVEDGQLRQDIPWECHFENALVEPERVVLDVCMGKFASGSRG